MRCRKPFVKLVVPLLALGVPGALGAGSASAAAPSQAKGDLVIGQITQQTSPATPGQKTTDAADTLKAWAKMVNAKGGANGYKVVVKTEDDGGDPAKASEAMKKLLAAGVVAIVGENATTTEAVWAPLATAAGVPIIGGGAYSAQLDRRSAVLPGHHDRHPRWPPGRRPGRGEQRHQEDRRHLRLGHPRGRGQPHRCSRATRRSTG